MPACGSPWLFAACHVLLRRMVPWHPPCALISLIFSSLFVLRPIVFLCFTSSFFILFSMKNSVCNWPFPFKSFLAVQLSRCKARFTLRFPSSRKYSLRVSRVRYSVFRPNPENDTEFKTQSTVNLHDARLPCSCSRSHAFLLLLQRFRFHLLRKCFLRLCFLIDLG